jgi:cyclase
MLIISAIDLIDSKCVRLTQGDYSKVKQYNDDPLKVAKEFQKQGADVLHVIDLEGAKSGRPVNTDMILKITKSVKLPLEVGGGIRTYQNAAKLLEGGVRRVILGTSAVENEALIKKIIQNFGAGQLIVSIDVKGEKVAVRGWKEVSEVSLFDFLERLKIIGIKTIIITDIKKDGMLAGPNFELIKKIIRNDFEVIIAGGVSSIDDIRQLNNLDIGGVIIGKALYEGLIDLSQAVEVVKQKNNLTKRIIPCLDIKNGRVVKGVHFKNLKDAGDPVELGSLYSEMGADELTFLDITATVEKRQTICQLVARIAEYINIPFTIGGGIRSIEDIRNLLIVGADKVSICSAAVNNPDLVKKASKRFGSQCIVISVDAKKKGDSWEIYINGGRKPTGVDAIAFSKQMQDLGAGELLVNSLDKDGTKDGYDIDLLQAVTEAVNIPVIASSGAGKMEDFLEIFQKTKVDAALAASLFHTKEISIPKLKKFLQTNKIKIRL